MVLVFAYFLRLSNEQWSFNIVVVCSEAYLNLVKEEILSYFSNYVGKGLLAVTTGSDTRHRSIQLGLNYFENRSSKLRSYERSTFNCPIHFL